MEPGGKISNKGRKLEHRRKEHDSNIKVGLDINLMKGWKAIYVRKIDEATDIMLRNTFNKNRDFE